jgi:hypothetical protein
MPGDGRALTCSSFAANDSIRSPRNAGQTPSADSLIGDGERRRLKHPRMRGLFVIVQLLAGVVAPCSTRSALAPPGTHRHSTCGGSHRGSSTRSSDQVQPQSQLGTAVPFWSGIYRTTHRSSHRLCGACQEMYGTWDFVSLRCGARSRLKGISRCVCHGGWRQSPHSGHPKTIDRRRATESRSTSDCTDLMMMRTRPTHDDVRRCALRGGAVKQY